MDCRTTSLVVLLSDETRRSTKEHEKHSVTLGPKLGEKRYFEVGVGGFELVILRTEGHIMNYSESRYRCFLRTPHKIVIAWLLCFCVSLFAAESDSLAAFNGIDYYSGRMVSGFGFSLNQLIQEKTGNQQTFETVPAFYYNGSSHFAVTVNNTTAVKKMESSDETVYQSNPLSNQTRLDFQIRPVSTLQIFPYMEFFDSRLKYNEHFMGDWYKEDKIGHERYGIGGMWLSGGEMLSLTPEQLKWNHYLSDDGLPWLPAGRIMVLLNAGVEKIKNQGFHKDLSEPTALLEKNAETTGQDIVADNTLLFGLSDRCLIALQSAYRDYHDDLMEQNVLTGTDVESGLDKKSYHINPSLAYRLHRNFYTQWFARISDDQCESNNEEFGLRSEKTVNVSEFSTGLSMHWFINTQAPDVNQYLANWDGLFGKRLPGGSWLISWQTSLTSEALHGTNEIIGIEGAYPDQDLEFRALESELNIRIGLSDFVEISLRSEGQYQGIRNERDELTNQWMPELSEQSGDARRWMNSVGVAFASFKYSDQYEKQYNWRTLSHFDQYYGSRLRPLMFRGYVGLTHVTYRNRDAVLADLSLKEDITMYTDWTGGFIDNQTWTTETAFQLGLWGNIEFGYWGTFYEYDSDLRNLMDTDWNVALSLSWQPWRSLRIQFSQEACRFAADVYMWPEDRFYDIYRVDQKTIRAWNIRIMSLF